MQSAEIICNALDNIIYILNNLCWIRNPLVSHEPMRNLPIDPVRNPVEPIRNKAETNWC